MPELPEVHTTVEGVKRVAVGKTIKEAWSDFHLSTSVPHRQTLKNKKYFENFKQLVEGQKIIDTERRGKNILINLKNDYTIIIHMKMTGHLMYGKYEKLKSLKGASWKAMEEGPLQDPYNQYIHFVLSLSDGKQLVLSDMRKFASITIIKTKLLHEHENVGTLGIDPLAPTLSPAKFIEILRKRKTMPIKSALLDQTGLAGIGNIYSDEMLWLSGVHPLSFPTKIPDKKFKDMFAAMREILLFSIKHGGDSKSDYRNIHGEKGGFQDFHKVYGRKNERCPKPRCSGIIERIVVKGRSTHFCKVHQIKY